MSDIAGVPLAAIEVRRQLLRKYLVVVHLRQIFCTLRSRLNLDANRFCEQMSDVVNHDED